MGRRSKQHHPPSAIRPIVAFNVATLRDLKYRHLPTVTARNRALAKDAGTTLSQIQRTIDQSLGTSIDLIERLAHALGVKAPDLLSQSFASAFTPMEWHGSEAKESLRRPLQPASRTGHGRAT